MIINRDQRLEALLWQDMIGVRGHAVAGHDSGQRFENQQRS